MMGLGRIKRVARRTRFQLRFVTKSTNSAVQLGSLFQCNQCNPMLGVGALLQNEQWTRALLLQHSSMCCNLEAVQVGDT